MCQGCARNGKQSKKVSNVHEKKKTAHQKITYQVRNETSASHRLDSLLCRLRLLLAVDNGYVRNVDLQKVVLAGTSPQLRHGLNKGHALNIANGSSELDNADIRLLARVVDGYARHPLDPVLDRICDVRDDLHGFTQVVAPPLALNYMLVYLARRDVVLAGEGDVQVALVVAEIEVDFAAVGEDEDFAVPVLLLNGLLYIGGRWRSSILLGVHGPRIDIEVRVDLDRRDVLWGQQGRTTVLAEALILRPRVLSSRPVEEAIRRRVSSASLQLFFSSSQVRRVRGRRSSGGDYRSWCRSQASLDCAGD